MVPIRRLPSLGTVEDEGGAEGAMFALPASTKRRRRTRGRQSALDISRVCWVDERKAPAAPEAAAKQLVMGGAGSRSSIHRRTRSTRSLAVRAKAIVACGCLFATAPIASGFSAICNPPRPPLATPSVSRRYLDDIIDSPGGGGGGGAGGGAGGAAGGSAGKQRGTHRDGKIEGEERAPVAAPVVVAAPREDEREEGEFEHGEFRMSAVLEEHAARERQRERSPRYLKMIAADDGAKPPLPLRKSRPNGQLLAQRKPRSVYSYPKSKDSGQSAIRTMCAELCQTKLLTKEEEYEMGTKIQALMQYTAIRDRLAIRLGREPSAEEWAESCCMTVLELQESVSVCLSAKQAMIRANMRMVISIARKYQHLGVPLKDLIQEGSMGLIRAVEKFDPERGFKLSTYSAWWIQQAVFQGIAHQSRVIRLPVHVHNLLNSVRRAQRELTSHAGEVPTDVQIATHLDMPVQRLKRYLSASKEAISIEVPASSQGHSAQHRVLGDTIESKDGQAPEKESDMFLFRVRLREVVEDLPEAEKIIVSLRFGLDDGKFKTIGEVADIVRTTRKHVVKVQGQAMRKLRSPDQRSRLRDFSSPEIALVTPSVVPEEILAGSK